MKNLLACWDGDSYPVYRFRLLDAGVVRDLTACAVWFDVWKAGTFLVRRPGTLVAPKTGGLVDCFLKGAETDWEGLGADLTVYPVLMAPWTSAGALGTNLLLNPSFDTATGTNPNRVANNWSVIGAQTSEIFDNHQIDPWPPVVAQGGTVQSVGTGATPATALEQQVAQGTAVGDWVGTGVWVRGDSWDSAASDDSALRLRSSGGADDVLARFPGSAVANLGVEWTFVTVERRMLAAHTTLTTRLEYKGQLNAGFRFDDAVMFLGRWRKLYCEPFRLEVQGRMRIPRTSNRLAGIGSFERDSNADGLPDGWMKGATFSPTVSREADPANVAAGSFSLKAVCSGGSPGQLMTQSRGRFLSGETWRASVKAKTSGTLTGTAPALMLQNRPFEGVRVSATAAVGQTLASFTTFTVDLALTADNDELQVRLIMDGTTGTLWWDDVQLSKV